MDKDTCKAINEIVKKKIEKLQSDVVKLNDVDCLIGAEVTETKKMDILNSIFALQEVQMDILDIQWKKQE